MRTLIWKYGLMLLFFSVFFYWGHAQSLDFRKVEPDEGSSFTSVTGINQDPDGFIWFSTKKGLYKYDGNKLTLYANNPNDPNSLSDNFLLCLHVDDDGVVWTGGLGTGMNRFDPTSNKFLRFQHDPTNPNSLLNDTINSILRDRFGNLWIATQQGLDRYDEATNEFIHFRSIRNDATTISDRQVRILYEDRQGTLWVGTGSPFPTNGGTPSDGGLNRYNREAGTFTRYEHITGNEQSLVNNKISSLYEDKDGNFWVGTAHNGLHLMNRKAGTFKRIVYDPEHPDKFSVAPYENEDPDHLDFIHCMTQDTTGCYWVGTRRTGLYHFNPKTEKMIHFQGTDPGEFTDASARSIFRSRDGIVWIGSDQGNLFYVNPIERLIPRFKTQASVVAFLEEKDGTSWAGTNWGVVRIDKKTGEEKLYTSELGLSEDRNDRLYSIGNDRSGNVWIGTTGGLYLWNSLNQTFKRFQHDPNNSKSISDNEVIAFLEDSKGNFWVATFRGLNLMDRKTGKSRHFWVNPNDTLSDISNVISFLFEDNNNNLWVGSWNKGGVHLFNRETESFKTYLNNSTIVNILQDSEGVLWVGAREGMFRYNTDIDEFIPFSVPGKTTSFPDIYFLLEDNSQNLWIGTANEIIRLNPQRTEASFYGQNFGVEKLNRFSGYKGRDGKIYFGNNGGYYSFDPAELLQKLPPPFIRITNFRLSDQVVRPNPKGILKKRIQESDEIRLNYNQNVFSFDFTIIDFANPKDNRLLYYLENYDKDWIEANAGRRAYYFNVPPGKYVFRVKGASSYGVWAGKKIEITVLPPWYRTWLAYVFYALIFCALIFAFDRAQRRRIVRKERLRNQERELAQAKEIEKAYNELKATQKQLIQAEKMASLGELTAGIAHEIQNPLNFVNNFSEVNKELIAEMKEEIASNNLDEVTALAQDIDDNEGKIIYHGKRADAIVKSMLLHSRGSSGQKERTDINTLADEYLRLSYHGLRAKDKAFNADFKLDAEPKLPKVKVIPQDIGRVLINLINNAFYAVYDKSKQKTEGYKPLVTVSTKMLDNKIEIRVKDNGSGIPDQLKEKIFQPFFTTKPTGQGTGLGLSLSYDIIKAHGGSMNVDSEENVGTEFIINLPL
ncbi:sensor histidine kinase [Maribellus sediminis]|uniref:sensor histidine kinase n=1 Tax=Maribellus sediminis TaxID=2696285 RepID=UPI00142FC47C|nr:sensor histidine kinase [Maribellus sediminis]